MLCFGNMGLGEDSLSNLFQCPCLTYQPYTSVWGCFLRGLQFNLDESYLPSPPTPRRKVSGVGVTW